jgi:putative DNA primase/helicase
LAKLQGTRLVFANESRSGLRLDEGLVKALTGRDTVTTRHLYSAEFDFIPQFKLWLRTNHVPSFDGADTGMQRRVKLIPFNTVVTKRDASLPTKLRGESDGILQWSLRGLKDYQQNGLIEPKVVKDASKEYVESLDTLAQFLDASCLREPRLEAPSDDLFKAYRDWASGMGLHGVGRARFAADMAARGFQKRVRDGRKYWCGLAFKEVDAGHIVVYRSGVPLAQ